MYACNSAVWHKVCYGIECWSSPKRNSEQSCMEDSLYVCVCVCVCLRVYVLRTNIYLPMFLKKNQCSITKKKVSKWPTKVLRAIVGVCVCVCMYTCVYMCVWIRIHIRICIYTCTFTYLYYIYMCVCVYVPIIYIHIYMHVPGCKTSLYCRSKSVVEW